MAERPEINVETIDVKRVEFEPRADGGIYVHIYESEPKGRKFDSKFEDKVELARQFENAKRLVIAFTKSKWRGGWNYYIEDIQAPPETDVGDRGDGEPAAAATHEAVPATAPPVAPEREIIGLGAAEVAIELVKL